MDNTLSREDIKAEGFVFKFEFDRQKTYKGDFPTKLEFEIGDKWKDGGRGGFLTFLPETSHVTIITTDEGFNQDGPNNSIKYKGVIKNRAELRWIMKRIGL